MKDFHKKLKNFIPIDNYFKNYGDTFLHIGYDKNEIKDDLELVINHKETSDKERMYLEINLIANGKTLFKHCAVFNTSLYTLEEAKDKASYYFICELVQYGVKSALNERIVKLN